MKTLKIKLIFLPITFGLTSILMLISSCQHESVPANQLEQISFSKQVLPVFQNSCGTSGCHDSKSAENGYVFTDYASIMKSITAGDASQSKAYQAMTSTFELMPPNNALPINKRTLIRLWIDQGAKQN